MRFLSPGTLFSLLGLAIVALLAGYTAAQMPPVFVPADQGVPQVPGNDSYTYYYSVWAQPQQQEDSPSTAPTYDYRPVAVCPWEAVADLDASRPEGRTPPEEAKQAQYLAHPMPTK
jgi:hypothetical protein